MTLDGQLMTGANKNDGGWGKANVAYILIYPRDSTERHASSDILPLPFLYCEMAVGNSEHKNDVKGLGKSCRKMEGTGSVIVFLSTGGK